MRATGLCGVSRRQWVTTTVRDRGARPAPDLVERNFAAAAPNRLWVADITYIPTWAGFLYLAVLLDTFKHRPLKRGNSRYPKRRRSAASSRSRWRSTGAGALGARREDETR